MTHPRIPPADSAGRTPTNLLLRGLDGSNPLGFLAALGLFRILDEASGRPFFRLSWAPSAGTWAPLLHPPADQPLSPDSILDLLVDRLPASIEQHPSNVLTDLDAVAEAAPDRRVLIRRIGLEGERVLMDWTAALASDFAPPEAINQLQTARRDYFLGNLRSVISRTTRDHLARAIFHPWDYADALDNQSLHLDPSEDRRHAYQWNKPAGDPDRKDRGGMLGANRLALEALPLFPSFPLQGTLRTLGFSGTRSTNTRWTWPIWSCPLSLPTVGSLLASEALQAESFDDPIRASLKAQGVSAVYRTNRILVGKTPNFTPSLCIA
jgi:CRISPR-associated endonuclease/helicase Cas3